MLSRPHARQEKGLGQLRGLPCFCRQGSPCPGRQGLPCPSATLLSAPAGARRSFVELTACAGLRGTLLCNHNSTIRWASEVGHPLPGAAASPPPTLPYQLPQVGLCLHQYRYSTSNLGKSTEMLFILHSCKVFYRYRSGASGAVCQGTQATLLPWPSWGGLRD